MSYEITMSKKEVRDIVNAYWSLLARARDVVGYEPFGAPITWDSKGLRLWIDKDAPDKIVLEWVVYESDYYAGGYCNEQTHEFPLSALLMSDADLKAADAKVRAEARARAQRLRRAQEAVAKDRREAHDRAEYARLKMKYETEA